MPTAVIAHTIDFYTPDGSISIKVHPPDKRRIMERLVPKMIRMAYSIGNNHPWQGPYPTYLQKEKNTNTLEIQYDSPFQYNPNTSNSGFFYCCFNLTVCESVEYEWPALDKKWVLVLPEERKVKIYFGSNGFLPEWFGYAFTQIPVNKDFDIPMYSNDGYNLPAPVWRCKVKTELDADGKKLFSGCIWENEEKL